MQGLGLGPRLRVASSAVEGWRSRDRRLTKKFPVVRAADGIWDLFRENGGPTLYTASNRTPVAGDATTITLCIVFGTLYLAFFVIFPGVRKERFTTFLSVTLSLFVGMAILRE